MGLVAQPTSPAPDPIGVALLGDRDPRLVTHRAVDATVELLPDWVRARWIGTDSPDARALSDWPGVWLLPGTPYRNEDVVYGVLSDRRQSGAPTLATCGGFQYVALEYARNGGGLVDVVHPEAHEDAPADIVAPLECSLVGAERSVVCVPGTRLAEICGLDPFTGFHWCSYGLTGPMVDALEWGELAPAAHAEDAGIEALELRGHPFYIATLFQPQMDGLDGGVHPLILAFVHAARSWSASG